MNRMIQFCFWLTCILLTTSSLQAQGVFNTQLTKSIQQVIEDYPNQFNSIIGDEISRIDRTIQYESKVNLLASSPAVITKYISGDRNSFSWQATVLESDDFANAAKKYKEVFNSLKSTIVRIKGLPPGILSAKYETPNEQKKFTTTAFKIIPGGSALDQLHIELTLQSQVIGWTILLMVYDDAQ